jgi:hypothetical protein
MSDLAPGSKLRKSPNRKLIKPIRTSRPEPKFDPKSKNKPWRLSIPPTDLEQASGKTCFATKIEAANEAGLIERQNRAHGSCCETFRRVV